MGISHCWTLFAPGERFIGNDLSKMAVPNCEFYEVFPCNGDNKFGLVEDIEVDDKGLVYAPTEPRLGYEIDWDLLRKGYTGTAE